MTQTYLTGIRGAIPLAQEQIDVMLRLIRAAQSDLSAILDLGCGDGILGLAVLDQYPQARAVFADFSEPMLEAARKRVDGNGQLHLCPSGLWGKRVGKTACLPDICPIRGNRLRIFDPPPAG